MKKEEDGLMIYGVTEKDQGDYTCVASTELDKDLAKAYLTVLGKALLTPQPRAWLRTGHPELEARLEGGSGPPRMLREVLAERGFCSCKIRCLILDDGTEMVEKTSWFWKAKI